MPKRTILGLAVASLLVIGRSAEPEKVQPEDGRLPTVLMIRPAATSADELLDSVVGHPAAGEPSSTSSSQRSPAGQTGQLAPVIVRGERYVDPFGPVPRFGFRYDFPLGPLPSYSYGSAGTVLSAARAPQAAHNVAPTAYILYAAALRSEPTHGVDGILRGVPGFSLSRRSDSLSTESSAQGAVLRGIGSSGATRVLMLLDGVPLNDPYGGWVTWTKVPREGLARVEAIPGGGAAVWGNSALGGVVQLFTGRGRGVLILAREPLPPGSPRTAEGKLVWGRRATLHARAEVGDHGTRSLEFSAVYPNPLGTLQILSRMFATDGFKLVAPEQRGSIDIPAWSRHRWVTALWSQPLSAKVWFSATVRGFEEQRGHGTPYQRNGAREKYASFAFNGEVGPNFRWNAVAYVQEQSSDRRSSIVNATRTAETPVSDQFACPASALGAAWIGTWKHAGNSSVDSPRSTLGADVRRVRGESRENVAWDAGEWSEQLVAGGAQFFAGLYGLQEWSLGEDWRATIGARLDMLSDIDGERRETNRISRAILRKQRYLDLDERQFSPSAGLVWSPGQGWRMRASAQQAFRRPTLNELFRPDRSGSNRIEANPELRTERVTSAELGVEWTLYVLRPSAPAVKVGGTKSKSSAPRAAAPRPLVSAPALTLAVTVFNNDIHDVVSEVALAPDTSARPAFSDAIVSFQRQNFALSRVRGVNTTARWSPWHAVSITADFLYNDATIRRAPLAPWLVGRRMAQVPQRTASLGATWRAPASLTLSPRLRFVGQQFEDIENQRRVGAVVVAGIGVSRPLNKNLELFFTTENVTNARIETGRDVNGIVTVGTPRLTIGGLRGTW